MVPRPIVDSTYDVCLPGTVDDLLLLPYSLSLVIAGVTLIEVLVIKAGW